MSDANVSFLIMWSVGIFCLFFGNVAFKVYAGKLIWKVSLDNCRYIIVNFVLAILSQVAILIISIFVFDQTPNQVSSLAPIEFRIMVFVYVSIAMLVYILGICATCIVKGNDRDNTNICC
jgi:hypothetical protein